MLVALSLLAVQFLLTVASGILVVFAFSCLPMPVPYLPTRRGTFTRALSELDLQPNDVFYDIGSGDGRVVLAAHRLEPRARCIGLEKRWGWHQVARYLHWKMGSYPRVEFRRGDFYTTSFADATKIYVFLCTQVMADLEPVFEQQLKGATLVSCGFAFPHKVPTRVIDLDASVGERIFRRLYVYTY